ncbi:MAG TPA: ComEC/Rec2 family competence protein [Pirellulaceae bacterium]|nr:ComEC/Rec2 family competence protein [Pirellulaceae bacterium]
MAAGSKARSVLSAECRVENNSALATPHFALPRYQPLVILLAAVAAGMVADRTAPLPAAVWWLAAALCLACWLKAKCRGSSEASWLIVAAAVASGGAWHHDRWRLYGREEIGRGIGEITQPLCLEGIALSSPRLVPAPPTSPLRAIPKGDESELLIEITAVRNGRSWEPASGRALLEVEGHFLGVNAGDRLRVMSLASRPSAPMNPGEFDYAAFQRSDRVLCRLRGEFPDSLTLLERASWLWPPRWLSSLRDAGNVLLRRTITPQRATLASAILLGAREQLDPERNEGYLVTGTIHVLSISGLHVGILAAGLLLVFRTGIVPRRFALVATMILTGIYALLTDAQPPVVRAAILIAATCTAQFLGRQTVGYNTLAAAGLVVLAHNPLSLFLVGTQLSFLAVATMIMAWPIVAPKPEVDPLLRLIAATRPWPVRAGRWASRRIGQLWLIGALIWLTSSPLVWMHYGLISPIAVVLNLVISLPIAVALYAGFGVLLLGWLVPPLAGACGWCCDYALAFIEGCIWATQSLPGSYVWTPPPPTWWVAGFYVALAAVAALPSLRASRLWIVSGLAVWIAGALLLASPPRGVVPHTRQRPLACTFAAVGHGTAAIIELPDGRAILYDCGRLGSPTFTARQIAAVLWSRGIRHLDAIIVSHADTDHFNALPGLLERFSVGVIYVSPVMFEYPQPALTELKEAVAASGVPLRTLRASERLKTGPGTRIEVLHPPAKGVYGSDNANSIVLLVEHAGRRLLLPGDLESPGLEDVLAEEPLDCDIVMAPHHGSASSDPTGFALWSTPEFVVVSGAADGQERARLESVRQSYSARGATVLPTAECGAIRFELSERGVNVETFRPQPGG